MKEFGVWTLGCCSFVLLVFSTGFVTTFLGGGSWDMLVIQCYSITHEQKRSALMQQLAFCKKKWYTFSMNCEETYLLSPFRIKHVQQCSIKECLSLCSFLFDIIQYSQSRCSVSSITGTNISYSSIIMQSVYSKTLVFCFLLLEMQVYTSGY